MFHTFYQKLYCILRSTCYFFVQERAMHVKRWFYLSIVFVFLVGCAASYQEEPSKSQNPSVHTAIDATQATAQNNTDHKITLQWYINYAWVTQKWGEDPVSKRISEVTGIDVEYVVPTGNETDKLTTMIASGMVPDLLTIWWGEPIIQDMINRNMLYSLNELADLYDPSFHDVAVQDRLDWHRTPDGNVYGYPNASFTLHDYENMTTIDSNQTFLVRGDIYKAIGSPDMTTPEGFLNALKDAKAMYPTVEGKPLIPLGLYEFMETGNASLQDYLQNFLAIPHEKDGKLYDRETDPSYITWLKTLRKANEMGLIANDVFVDKRTQVEEKVAQKQYFAMLYQWSDCQVQNRTIYATTPESAYIAIDGPKNEKGDPHCLDGPSIGGWTLTMISKDTKYPERAIKLLSYLMGEEGQKYIWAGIEGQAYDMIDGKVVYRQEMLDLFEKDSTAFRKQYGANTTHWPMMDSAMAMEKGWLFPDPPFVYEIKKWTTQYAVNPSTYMLPSFESDTDEAISEIMMSEERGKVLPQLMMSESDEEFDAIWEKYLMVREENGFSKVMEKRQEQLETNKAKMSKQQ